jgi:integrase
MLKELGKLCGIAADKMTTHVGRKTAGTLLLNMGVPLPVVSKFLGHANVLITQKLYAELLDTTVVDAFAQLGGYALTEPSAELAPFELAA